MKFKFALWTRQAVQELIKRQYGLEIPRRTFSDYLKAWGFTCQKLNTWIEEKSK
jgi:transposase